MKLKQIIIFTVRHHRHKWFIWQLLHHKTADGKLMAFRSKIDWYLINYNRMVLDTKRQLQEHYKYQSNLKRIEKKTHVCQNQASQIDERETVRIGVFCNSFKVDIFLYI